MPGSAWTTVKVTRRTRATVARSLRRLLRGRVWVCLSSKPLGFTLPPQATVGQVIEVAVELLDARLAKHYARRKGKGRR